MAYQISPEFRIHSSRTKKKREPTEQNQDQPHPTTQRIQSMSGHQFSASNRDVDRNIREAKEFALDAFELGLGTTYLTPLQKGFYNRFKELESNPWASKEGSRSTLSSAQKQPCSNPRSLLNAKLGKLHTKLSPTCLRLVSRVR